MGDPERLRDMSGGEGQLARDLFEDVPRLGPPPGAKERAWEALAGTLAVGAAVGAGAGTAQAAATAKAAVTAQAAATATKATTTGAVVAASKVSSVTGALVAKVLTATLAGGVAVGGGIWALSSPAPEPELPSPQQQQVREVPAPLHEVEPPPPVEFGLPETEPEPPAPELRAKRKPRAARQLDLLKREAALVKRARAQLKAGDTTAARVSLNRLKSEFRRGALGQEREVLAVKLLAAEGQLDRARQRARAFMKRHPQSPHSAALRALSERP